MEVDALLANIQTLKEASPEDGSQWNSQGNAAAESAPSWHDQEGTPDENSIEALEYELNVLKGKS